MIAIASYLFRLRIKEKVWIRLTGKKIIIPAFQTSRR